MAQEELIEWLSRQEIIWRQKSRKLWLKAGDNNSRFFHASTVTNRRKIFIPSIKNQNGTWLETREQIGDYLTKEFTDLFKAESGNREQPLYDFINPSVTNLQNTSLSCIHDRREIWDSVKSLHLTKAPGPDGMSAIFFQHFWETVGDDVTSTIQNIFKSGIFPKGLNDSFIILIPKTNHLTTFNQIRPIALCNTLYKVLSKILVNHLCPLLHNLVSPNQTAFVPGRWIGENSIMV